MRGFHSGFDLEFGAGGELLGPDFVLQSHRNPQSEATS